MDRPVLVVQHEDECPPAWFGTWMTEAGAALDVRKPYAGDPLPADLAGHRGVLVLGGAMNAVDEVATPWLVPTKALVREAVADDVPLLGICLGHQIVAEALGGTVSPNPLGRQRGLLPIGWTPAAEGDALFGGRPVRAAHWNDDVVTTPPPGATVLAVAPGGEVQALRFDARAWGIQSHPEVDDRVLARWADQELPQGPAERAELDAFLAEVAAAHESLVGAWAPVAAAFSALRGG